ncbi:MAG: ribosome assembly factor SBDS [Candidatus Thermoplasmatota archaeon]
MVSLEEAVVARLEAKGLNFEILVDPEAIEKLKRGEGDIISSLAVEEIFKDSKKGDRAAEENIMKVFGTKNIEAVAKQIIERGEIQLTTEQRRKMQEMKKKQIITMIVKNAINPQTKTPHPPQRIETAINEAKVRIDPFKPVDVQVKDVLNAIKTILPIRFETVKIAVKISGEDYGKMYSSLKAFGEIKKEEWSSDGKWIGLIEMPAGMQVEFFEMLNEKTKGNVETKIVS